MRGERGVGVPFAQGVRDDSACARGLVGGPAVEQPEQPCEEGGALAAETGAAHQRRTCSRAPRSLHESLTHIKDSARSQLGTSAVWYRSGLEQRGWRGVRSSAEASSTH
eukprot:6183003-Pleurochrysis_carterae.AAC.1